MESRSQEFLFCGDPYPVYIVDIFYVGCSRLVALFLNTEVSQAGD
jgi:hypothetical protein